MKRLLKIAILGALLVNASSCAYMFNEKTVEVAIESTPPGADIIIEGRSYGKTPKLLRIEPKNYDVTLTKAGYGTTQFKMESWQALREGDKAEGKRCLADALGTMFILPAFSYWSSYCREFKQSKYSVNIPYQGPAGSNPAYGRGGVGGGVYYNNSYNQSGASQGSYYGNGAAQQGNQQYYGGGSAQQKNSGRAGEYYDNRSYNSGSGY